MTARSAELDPRVWILWGIAASLPTLLGRNPWPIAAAFLVALGVRASRPTSGEAWQRLLRLVGMFAAVGVLFNLLTYHGGDVVIVTLPAGLPIIGGAWTVNALVYGAVSGLALVTLVVVWSTVSQRLAWAAIVRSTPPALAAVAAAGSIALTLTPRTIEAFLEIREAQALRGFRPRGPRDLAPLVAPVLALGLERAATNAEALESRGFGGPERDLAASASGLRAEWRIWALVVALLAGAVGAYLLAVDAIATGLGALILSAALGVAVARVGRDEFAVRPTRYVEPRLTASDWRTLVVVGVSFIATFGARAIDAAAFAWEPYPALAWPAVAFVALAAQALLFAPAFATPLDGGRD